MKTYMWSINNALRKILLYDSPIITTSLDRDVKLLQADVIASGRPSPFVEKFIEKKVLPYYANTHSNAYCGIRMKNMIRDVKRGLREHYDTQKKVIFTGSGTTSAINHLVNCLCIKKLPLVHVFTTSYEHHSNYLPWVELQKDHMNVIIHVIPIQNDYELDLDWLDNQLTTINRQNHQHVCIVAITACSNVTGIMTDTKKVWKIVQKGNQICPTTKEQCPLRSNLLFLDLACSAPYVQFNGDECDAFYFSPHKFLGGPGTPGVLMADKSLFINDRPYEPGGGCVSHVNSRGIIYSKDVEEKESAGTPNIIGIIKIGQVIFLKEKLDNLIHHNEMFLTSYIHRQVTTLQQQYPQLIVVMPSIAIDHRLPILCIGIKDMHYNLIVVLFNDLFGIQTRGGVSCTGLLAELIEKDYGIKGWCRISFSWMMTIDEVNYIMEAIRHILINGTSYKNQYQFNTKANLWYKKS